MYVNDVVSSVDSGVVISVDSGVANGVVSNINYCVGMSTEYIKIRY